jgi:hypothetical protein
MKKWVFAGAAVVILAGPANAAVLTLESVRANGPSDFTFSYESTLGPDEGLRNGDQFVIFDFAGYIGGSVATATPLFAASVEFTSPTALVTPAFADDANIANLVFTYVGADFRAQDGPFSAFNFNGLSARSTLGGLARDAFYTRTTKNNPDGARAESRTAVFTLGSVSVPDASNVPNAIPEPATWAMMLGGFGMLGGAMRRHRRVKHVLA